MKRSAKIIWWGSLAFTLLIVGSIFYPIWVSGKTGGMEKSWGDWNNLVGLEVPSGEVKRFDMYGHFDGGCGTTWFLCRVNETWLQECIHRFGLKTDEYVPAVMDDESLERLGAFRKWGESPDLSCWTKMIGGPFLWKDGMRPTHEGDVFHYRVFLSFSPDRKEAVLGLDRDFGRDDKAVRPLHIAEGGESWMTMVERNVPEFLIFFFILATFGLCVLAPCLLVWLPVWAQVKKSPEKVGTALKFWYYAGTIGGSLLFFSCCILAITLESSISGAFLLFLGISALLAAVMLSIARSCLSRQMKRGAK